MQTFTFYFSEMPLEQTLTSGFVPQLGQHIYRNRVILMLGFSLIINERQDGSDNKVHRMSFDEGTFFKELISLAIDGMALRTTSKEVNNPNGNRGPIQFCLSQMGQIQDLPFMNIYV